MYRPLVQLMMISIHAPREGGDGDVDWSKYNHKHFNPRPPRGGRHQHTIRDTVAGAISIHAPREGGDSWHR